MFQRFKNSAFWLQVYFPKFWSYHQLNVEPAVSLYCEEEDIPRAKQTPSLQPQHTSADGSFSVEAKQFSLFHILLCVYHSYLVYCLPHPHALSHFPWFSVHQAFLSGSFPPFPAFLSSLLLQLSGMVTGGSSEDAHISRCLPLQKCVSEELAFDATMQDGADSNIVGHFVTSPPEHQLALI